MYIGAAGGIAEVADEVAAKAKAGRPDDGDDILGDKPLSGADGPEPRSERRVLVGQLAYLWVQVTPPLGACVRLGISRTHTTCVRPVRGPITPIAEPRKLCS